MNINDSVTHENMLITNSESFFVTTFCYNLLKAKMELPTPVVLIRKGKLILEQ